MKKAIGELSGTLIVVTSVAILVAFFYYVVWPVIDTNFKSQTNCKRAICYTDHVVNGKVACYLKEKPETVFQCNFEG